MIFNFPSKLFSAFFRRAFFFLSLFFCLLFFSFSASAQDLKPVKDKSTKKYGFQDKKTKQWVIAPRYDDAWKFKDGFAEVELNGHRGIINTAGEVIVPVEYDKVDKFDRYGFSEIMRKENGVKRYGFANTAGQFILPVQYRSVKVSGDGSMLYAKQDTRVEGFRSTQLWGVYNTNGQEIFAPQFLYTPTFTGDLGKAQDGVTGLYGLISRDGKVVMPFKYLALEHTYDGYKGLETDMSHTFWSPDLTNFQTIPQRGAIIPYDPKNDIIRAAAWYKGPIGRRLYCNNVKVVELRVGHKDLSAFCRDVPVDWGFGRFIRLEPVKVGKGTPNAMSYSEGGSYYTLKALLYERDGRFVKELCNRGWLEAACNEGMIYNTGGDERWLILADPNALGLPAYTMEIFGYQPIEHYDVIGGLGLSPNEISRLYNMYDFQSRLHDIYEGENVGVTTYTPRIPEDFHAIAERDASRAPIFRHIFRMGDVVNCNVIKNKDGKVKVELFDDLVCAYRDRLEDPFYTTEEREEFIYWGPHNARTIGLSLQCGSRTAQYLIDDVYGTKYSYTLVLSLYEEDGTWLRTLAEAPWVDYVQDGWLIFESIGIAMRSPFIGRGYSSSMIVPSGSQGQPSPQGQHNGQNPQGQQPSGQQYNGQSQTQSSNHQVANRSGGAARTPTKEVNGGARQGAVYTPTTPSTPKASNTTGSHEPAMGGYDAAHAPVASHIDRGPRSFGLDGRKPYGPVMDIVTVPLYHTISALEKSLGAR